MGMNLHLSTCIEDKTDPSKAITSVVPATTSPIPKSEWKEKYFLKENRIVVSQRVYVEILMYLLLTMWGPYIGCLGF